jgi:hypothetical protein
MIVSDGCDEWRPAPVGSHLVNSRTLTGGVVILYIPRMEKILCPRQ